MSTPLKSRDRHLANDDVIVWPKPLASSYREPVRRQQAYGGRAWQVTALSLKAIMVVLLLLALAFPDWDRFADKAMGARAIFYPLSAMVVPAAWLLWRRNHSASRFPWDVHAFLVAPFVIDLAGNAVNLFDTVSWFDDACHFGNWALLGAAAGALLLRGTTTPPWLMAVICTGVGAIAAIGWEIAEYFTFILGTPETVDLYRDTMMDEALGTSGAALAGVLTALAVRRRRRGLRQPVRSGA